MKEKKTIILPEAVARDIVRKSIEQVAGGGVKIGAEVTLRDVGVKSRTDLVMFRKLVAVELAKAAAKRATPIKFAKYLEIRPNQTGKQLWLGLQKAYTLGLSGDVIPPDYDDE